MRSANGTMRKAYDNNGLKDRPDPDAVAITSSLRANGSRERAPDDRLREAIQKFIRGSSLDCFVAALLAMTITN